MEHGTVKWYNEGRGKGRIAGDDGDKDLAVTHSSIICDGFKVLHEGQRVTFERAWTADGPTAVCVIPCGE